MSQLLDPVVLLIGAVIIFFTGIFVGVVWENRASVSEKLSTKKGLLEEETTPLGLVFLFVILFCSLCWLLWDNLKTFFVWIWGSWVGLAFLSGALLLIGIVTSERSASLFSPAMFVLSVIVTVRALFLWWKLPLETDIYLKMAKGWEKKMNPPTDTDNFKPE